MQRGERERRVTRIPMFEVKRRPACTHGEPVVGKNRLTSSNMSGAWSRRSMRSPQGRLVGAGTARVLAAVVSGAISVAIPDRAGESRPLESGFSARRAPVPARRSAGVRRPRCGASYRRCVPVVSVSAFMKDTRSRCSPAERCSGSGGNVWLSSRMPMPAPPPRLYKSTTDSNVG